MLKLNVTQDEFDSLDEGKASLYKQADEGYALSVDLTDYKPDGVPELKRAKDREVQKRKDAEKRAGDLQAKFDDIAKSEADSADLDARKKGDIETLEKSWASKLDDANNSHNDINTSLRSQLTKNLVDNQAFKLATELGTAKNAKLLMPHIKSRMSVDFDNGDAKMRITSLDGEISAMDINDLKKEFIANSDYESIIVAGKGSGSGASGLNNDKGSAIKTVADFKDATEESLYAKNNPESYQRIVENS